MDWKTQLGKRVIDVALATAGLAVAAPILPVIALAIRATSKGPIFYSQERCGADRRSGVSPRRPDSAEQRNRNGEANAPYHTFRMVKFRTMRADAEATTGAVLARENDDRLTPVGGFLRRTRLDELPQLLHVLKGDMSLIGPRPERPELMEKIENAVPFFQERMRFIKPGITGLAQIKLNYDGSFDRDDRESRAVADLLAKIEIPGATSEQERRFANKLLYDLAYSAILENPTEWLKTDLEIISKTPLVMLFGKGR